MVKEMRKICAGTVRNRDKTWFSEHSDKGVCGRMEIQIYGILSFSKNYQSTHVCEWVM